MIRKILLLIILLPSICHSAPAISTVSTFNGGSSVTVTGSWNSDGDNTPMVWDNFESGSLNSTLNSTPQIGSWGLNSTPSPTIYSNAAARSGSRSAYSKPDRTGAANVNISSLSTVDKAIWSFWFRFDLGGQPTGSQVKTHQLYGLLSDATCDFGPGVMSGGTNGLYGWLTYNIASGSDCSTGYHKSYYPFYPTENQWHYTEMTLQRSSADGVEDGTIILTFDGVKVYNYPGNILTRKDGQNWQVAKVLYDIKNDLKLASMFVDDVYFNDSWSRVVLGNAPVYSDCTEIDIQPVTAWTGLSITILANPGDRSTGDPAYLFVIDADNIPSAGKAITIGTSSSTTDAICGDQTAVIDVCPSTNLCYSGTAGTVTQNADTCTWTCSSSDGGLPASCSADFSTAVVTSDTYQFSAATAEVDEGNAVALTITRTGDTSVAGSITYSTTGITASGSLDYWGTNGETLVFAIDEISKTFTIETWEDADDAEGDEVFDVDIDTASGSIGTVSKVTVTIHDSIYTPPASYPPVTSNLTGTPVSILTGGIPWRITQ